MINTPYKVTFDPSQLEDIIYVSVFLAKFLDPVRRAMDAKIIQNNNSFDQSFTK